MADEREPLEPKRVGERENVIDQDIRFVRFDLCRPVRTGKAALVGHDEKQTVVEQRRDLAPGAVRFGKAVEQDHRRCRGVAGKRDVEGDSGAERDPLEFGQG
jgi:hypothetical protein